MGSALMSAIRQGASFARSDVTSDSSKRLCKEHAQYIKHWINRLQSNPKAAVQAASQAQKAVDLILDGSSEEGAS